jgi:hypothetical protein
MQPGLDEAVAVFPLEQCIAEQQDAVAFANLERRRLWICSKGDADKDAKGANKDREAHKEGISAETVHRAIFAVDDHALRRSD